MITFLPLQIPPISAPAPHPATSSTSADTLRVVVVYDDRVAGERAMRALDDLQRQVAPGVTLCPIPWGFDFLCELRWRARALHDVNTADILILSINQPDEMPASIDRWIATCLKQKRRHPMQTFVLLDSNEAWALTLEAIDHATAQFTAPAPRSLPEISPDAAALTAVA